VWPFPTKQLSAYLSTHGLLAWEMLQKKGQAQPRKLSAMELKDLTQSIDGQGQLPSALKQHKTTLRLAPELGRCYTLQTAQNKLGEIELTGLAEHWGRTFMGPQFGTWQWQAVQVEIEQPILLCACKADTQHLNAFETVKPELLYHIDALKKHSSAWVICRDEALVQSALVLEGKTASIRTWPSHYANHVQEVIEKHLSCSDTTRGLNINHVIESRLGEVQIHGSP
jgi:hypothetical protein